MSISSANDPVCDKLKQATSVNGQTCTNDILGNRLTKGSNTYGWDALNRLTSYNATTYQYRADGMRTRKTVGSATTTYRYDGQMGMQDVVLDGATTTITNYALGARGIDAISTTTNGGTAVVTYPLYDAHGNMISTLSKSGSGYTYSALRSFDAWGVIRTGATTGDPKGRYCASIGHKQDDESGLIYMRARYYEPGSGRFVSEDSGRDGVNWLTYCANDPVNRVDANGNKWQNAVEAFIGGAVLYVLSTSALNALIPNYAANMTIGALVAGVSSLIPNLNSIVGQLTITLVRMLGDVSLNFARAFASSFLRYASSIEQLFNSLPQPPGGIGSVVIMAACAYAGVLAAELALQDAEGL